MAELSIIGLDGVNWKVLEHAVQKGYMPNLERILQDAYTAELETTYPSVTGPAWTSIMTGDNPGRHGIFDFLDHTDERRPYSSHDIESRTIYEAVADEGEVALVNLPLSYPPKFEGEFIGSFLAPENDFVYPDNLRQQIDLSDYKKSLSAFEKGFSVIESGKNVAEAKSRLVDRMLDEQDMFFLLFSAPDWIMHNHYHQMREGENDAAYEVFQVIDETLETVRKRSKNILLLSDHGFNTFDRVFHVNQWLENQGFLETSGSMEADFSDNRLIDACLSLVTSTEAMRRISIRSFELVEDYLPIPENHKVGIKVEMSKGIDREKSVAFCPSSGIRGIYLNDERFDSLVEDRQKMLDEITSRLPESVDWRRADEVFDGPEKHRAPDIVFEENSHRVLRTMYGKEFSTSSINHHGRKGFLAIRGQNFEASDEMDSRDLYDVAPTIAELFELDFDADGDSIPIISETLSLSGDLPDDF